MMILFAFSERPGKFYPKIYMLGSLGGGGGEFTKWDDRASALKLKSYTLWTS